MKKRLIFCLVATAFLALVSYEAQAGNAGLLLSPTRVVLEGGKRFVTLTVKNSGDATGRYKVELVDAVMHENGAIKVLEAGNKAEFSAIGLLSLSPSSMTLGPNENQNVRLLVKYKEELPEGEYRAHLQVRMTESNLNPDTSKPVEGTGIAIQTKMTTVIPVIIRKGQTAFTVTVDDAKLLAGGGDKKQSPEVMVNMSFSGNRSVLGDIKITHIAADAKETQLAFLRGLAIYRGVAKRNQTVSLTVPDGVNVRSGRLRVSFLSQENEGSHVLSEKVITP